MAALGGGPVRIFTQQFDVEFVQPPGGAHVDGVVRDLLDGGNARQRQEEAKVVGEVFVSAGDSFAAGQLFGFQHLPIGGEDEFGLCLGGGRAGAQGLERVAHLARFTHCEVDVVVLKHATRHI